MKDSDKLNFNYRDRTSDYYCKL